MVDEAGEQIAIGSVRGSGSGQTAEPAQDVGDCSVGHGRSPPAERNTLPRKERSRRRADSWARMKIHEDLDASVPTSERRMALTFLSPRGPFSFTFSQD